MNLILSNQQYYRVSTTSSPNAPPRRKACARSSWEAEDSPGVLDSQKKGPPESSVVHFPPFLLFLFAQREILSKKQAQREISWKTLWRSFLFQLRLYGSGLASNVHQAKNGRVF